jgi:ubiquinone/menaquinone biosynthesis C-methylase UbiE
MNDFGFFLHKFLRIWPPHMAIIRAYEANFFKQIASSKNPTLDLGCGDGDFLKNVFEHFDTGIDLDMEKLKRAKRGGAYSILCCCNASQLPLPDNYFHTIISNCVLEHIPDVQKVIQEVSRVLHENGEFIFTTWTPLYNKSLWINKEWYINWKTKRLDHFTLLSLEEWKKILEKNNLQITWTQYYVHPRDLKQMDFYETISLLGFGKIRIINLYSLIIPLFPTFLTKIIARAFEKRYGREKNKNTGCAVAIKAKKRLSNPNGERAH